MRQHGTGARTAAGDFASVDPDELAAHGRIVAVRADGPGSATLVRLMAVERERPERTAGGEPQPPRHGVTRANETMMRAVRRSPARADAPLLAVERLPPDACTLSVYASQPGSPPDHETLDSGWWPALTGQGSHLLGRIEGFRHVYPSTCLPPSPSFAWRNT